MKHLGDITKLSGYTVPVVDVITGGSPCQDLSMAGKRAGLDGERSGLFMEQIRIVKEMRQRDRDDGRADELLRPRYMVWENVPGAFSSNGGADFQAVLTEIVRIAEPEAPNVPMPDKAKWSKSGCIYDDMGRWSVAWRVHDAQFWGVPQRRKRIALVADFGGLTAPEILFERKGLSRHFEPCGKEGKGTAGTTGRSTTGEISFSNRGQYNGKVTETLRSDPHGAYPCVMRSAALFQPKSLKEENWGQSDVKNAIRSGESKGSHALVYNIGSYHSNAWKSPNPNSGVYEAEVSKTLDALNCGAPTCNQGETCVVEPLFIGNGQADIGSRITEGVSQTLNCMHDPLAVMTFTWGRSDHLAESDIASCQSARQHKSATDLIVNREVRRLTPLECERLQGYPDGWTDIGEWVDSKGKKHKEADSPRYKALGNSIALPFWQWMARRICAQYERNITMASLFDGIGGFPLVFERCGAKAVWASEIEEFPMAVTKRRFPERSNDGT